VDRNSVSLLEPDHGMILNEFEEVVLQHYEPLYRFAYGLARTESDAGDLTQHAFYVWATKGYQLRDRSKVKTWLFTTLHRAFFESRRRQARFPHQSVDEIALEDLPTSSPACVDTLDSSQALAALAQVDEIYQAAVALFYLEDYSYKEISEILEVPIGTVKSRISRGIMQLRELLDCSAPEPAAEAALDDAELVDGGCQAASVGSMRY
jgi:RNA polymerase sigma factor (sigma-70 family)